MPDTPSTPVRRSQADRRAATRSALLESAARGISRDGYGRLVLEQVAADAGFTRGALYHHFADKDALTLAVVEWGLETWRRDVGALAAQEDDPVEALIALARGHAVYCRQDIAPLLMTLRAELGGHDHPVGRAVDAAIASGVRFVARLVVAGRASGAIPDGPPPELVGRAYVGALEGGVIAVAGEADWDEELAERVVRGVLGLGPAPGASGRKTGT